MNSLIATEALRDVWYPVAEPNDIDPGPLSVTLLGQNLVLWRNLDDKLTVAADRCPHREAPLSIGCVSDGELVCSYHGWSFAGEGRCVGIPSSGDQAVIPPNAHLSAMHAQERYGLVWVCLGNPTRDIPLFEQENDPAFRRINTGVEIWHTSCTRMVDNFLDISHFPWVHSGTFGGAQDPQVPKITLEQLDQDFYGYAYEVDAKNPDDAVATTGTRDEVVHRQMSTGFSLPFIVRSTIRYEDGLEHIILLSSTPVDDVTSIFTFVVWRNDDHSTDAEAIISFDRAIGAEDKAMLEQVPGVLPLTRTALVSVQSDKPSVEWRRRLAAMLDLNR